LHPPNPRFAKRQAAKVDAYGTASPRASQWMPPLSGYPFNGVTCCTHGVCRDTTARRCVPQLCSGVSGCFDEVETRHPARMGSVSEPGSFTLPRVTPTERVPPIEPDGEFKGLSPLNSSLNSYRKSVNHGQDTII
jgi:hypothetical protein